MIPATQPKTVPAAAAVTYDQWVPVTVGGDRPGPGVFRMSVVLRRCRVLADGTTDLSPDPADVVALDVADVNAPVSAAYPQAVRDAVQQAAAAILQAAAAFGTARGVL